ncbi:Retrovirus-related Pol polyprotein from transposon RE1 [Vitis vinifera]|uniref:Retrovirus-related Pol polyprotein from transposon RE1 n=1 Tax=Vitis vinifera TaxID=29760 RepID=A0A438HTI6_VITVI|nr:Retrovirus-related Pol polyprotein from transposon RE1 [Vitis vinifera]
MITSEKLVGSENYLSWSASVELWFMGQGYEDHLVSQEADIPEVDRVQWRKIDAQLCQRINTTNDIQRLYKVASAIVHLSQQDLDLSTYIGQIASLKEQFLTVMPLTPDVGAQQTQLDKFFMVLTLIGLRPDLEPIRDQILGSSSVPSLDDVFARLLRISSTQTLPSDSASDSSVLVSQTTSRGGRSGTRGRGQRPHCTYCNKLGHTRDRCYQLHGRPPRTAHMAQSSDSPLPQPPSSSASQTSQASIASVAQPGNASACLTHTSSLGPWILDSGASDHLSGNKDLFSSITTTSDLPTVTLANGSQTVAKGIGLALPLPSLPLTSDRSTGKTIGIGRESQGLYHLTSDSSPAVCISTDAPLLIHNRLGHPSLSKFQKMVPRFSTLSSLPCESCQLGKHTRVSFPKRLNNRAKSPFELVHTDVWGPCRTASTLGFQYFVTFIDDYSRSQFTSFMSHHGILHQSSCAHTPQQNGVAERKNRHLVETARTLLLHSHVPFRFWGDAVLTACYLINRMPSSVLHDQIPHSLLFPDQPLYFLPPRVFGCTCFTSEGLSLLFPETHRYFISADVTFFEESPFFSTTSESLPVSEVLPIPIVSPPDAMPPRPLQVYHRHPRVVAPLPFPEAPADSLPIPSASPAPALPSPNDLPIAVRKVKVGPDGQVDRLKARLVAKGYTQVYGSDYGDTFSPVAKIASVRLLLSMAAMCSWPLYQLDIKNVFLHGDLAEEVYMEQPPGFVAQGESGLVCRLRRSLYGLKQSPRAWFSRFSSVVQEFGMLRSSDQDGIQKTKATSFYPLSDQDLGKLKYFLGIEIAQSSSGVVLSQRKYALDILEETGQGEPLGDPGRYRRLVGKLNYLTITRPDISFPSKKQDVVARSSAEAEYRAMALATCELIWLRHLLQELRFGKDEQMKLICDNQAALHIASNPVFHERTKHIEVDCHFIREKIASGCVATSFVNSNDQLADIFTKSLRGPRINIFVTSLVHMTYMLQLEGEC